MLCKEDARDYFLLSCTLKFNILESPNFLSNILVYSITHAQQS